MDALNRLNEIGCWDYRIRSFDGSRLTIVGSTNLAYYHLVQIEFGEVFFLSCPVNFSNAKFRTATEAERVSTAPLVSIDPEDILFSIEAESSGSLEPQVFFILAQTVTLTEGLVSYAQK